MAFLVGIDLGSTTLKAVVSQENGTVVAKLSTTNTLYTPLQHCLLMPGNRIMRSGRLIS